MSCSLVVENKNYPESVIEFTNYLGTIKNKSKNTIIGYKSDLGLFFKYLSYKKNSKKYSNIIDIEDIDITNIGVRFIQSIELKDLYAFMNYLENEREKKNGECARARKVATLKSYYNYIFKKAKIVKENIAEELEAPKINRRQPDVLDIKDSEHLLESLDKKNKFYNRDYCMLTLLLHCGMRLEELTNIKIENIKNDVLTIIGKGSKERKIYLDDTCLKVIADYLVVRDDSKCDKENKKFLFISRLNRHIHKNSIEVLVKKHLGNAGFDLDKYHTHSTRASFATMQHSNGVDLTTLQRAMGHESPSTTTLYINIDEDKLRNASKNNPLNHI